MKRRDLSITIALCLSLLAHGFGMIALTEYEIHELGRGTYQAPFNLLAWLASHPRSADLQAPSVRATLPLAQALPEPKLPDQLEEAFGERGGKGKASNSNPGDLPMLARQAPEEQSTLTPHQGPSGDTAPNAPGNDGNSNQSRSPKPSANSNPAVVLVPFGPPVDPNMPFGMPLAPAPPPLPPKAYHKTPPPIIGIPTASADPFEIKSAVTMKDSPATRPVDMEPTTRPMNLANAKPTTSPVTDEATTQPVTASVKERRPDQFAVGQMPTTTQPSLAKLPTTRPTLPPQLLALASTADGAHPDMGASSTNAGSQAHVGGGEAGHESETESDAFTNAPSFTYRNGKVEARDGRKVKCVKPRLTEAGYQAVNSIPDASVVFGVKIDDAGKVTGVDYIRKSGSNEIDLPAYLAVWKWEFEPSKDKDGHPKPDAFVIALRWVSDL